MTNNPADQTIREAGPLGPSPASHPARIGPYRILRVLCQGGMGVVYEAEQLQPLRRMVALKVVRPGLDTREVLARFESERQALAVMDHPNIAKALDAGTTDAGLPYFVIELVLGLPITGYCDTHRLDTRRRLQPKDYGRVASVLAALLIDEQRYAEAEPLALRVLTVRDSMADTLAKKSVAQLVTLYEAWGKADRVAEFRRRAERSK